MVKNRLDFERLRFAVTRRHPDVAGYVDPKPRPSWAEFRRTPVLSIRVWQYGNSHPRIDASLVKPKDYDVLRSVMAEIERQRDGPAGDPS